MRKTFITLLMLLATAITAMAQYSKPYFTPGEGVYIVGLNKNLAHATNEPTMVAEAYEASFNIHNAILAMAKANTKSYNLTEYIENDALLNLKKFMGIGEASNLRVLNEEGESYQLGDLAKQKTWTKTHLLAAYPKWNNKSTLPLGVYNSWDCDVTYASDPMLENGKADAVTVDFGNPHGGLVISSISFPIVNVDACDASKSLTVTLREWNSKNTGVEKEYELELPLADLTTPVATKDGKNVYMATLAPGGKVVVKNRFEIVVSGLAQAGVDAWIARTVDENGLFPTHTTYTLGKTKASDAKTDACIAVEGYFNYIGTWNWYDGHYERGEAIPQGDLVQVYYDPADPDWPGDYYKGEAAFPIESTFGKKDIVVAECPEWIFDVSIDDSQWAEYGALQLSMSASTMPEELTGRNGKVVFETSDGACQYTIYVRQGNAKFEIDEEEEDNYAPYLHAINCAVETFYKIGEATEDDLYLDDGEVSLNANWGVTVVDFEYDAEFDKLLSTEGVTITNLTNDRQYELMGYKMGVTLNGKRKIRVRLSTSNYINTKDDQGYFEIVIPEGVAITTDGRLNEPVILHFTYGDPKAALPPTGLSLEDYLGKYVSLEEGGYETEDGQILKDCFEIVKDGSAYSLTGLGGSTVQIPVQASGTSYVLKATTSADYIFGSPSNGNVAMNLTYDQGTKYIYFDEAVLQTVATSTTTKHGAQYYVLTDDDTDSISLHHNVAASASQNAYNIVGQRIDFSAGKSNYKGLYIVNGRKMMVR